MEDLAIRNGCLSNDWFSHEHRKLDGEDGWCDSANRLRSTATKVRLEKHNGGNMQRCLQITSSDGGAVRRGRGIPPAAQEFAQRNTVGVMSQFLNHNHAAVATFGYESPQPAPRAVRPEAQATFEKNKGVMDEFLQGYPAPAMKKTVHKSRPADDELVKKHSGSVMGRTIYFI